MNLPPSPILAAAETGIFSFLHTMKGPEFLGLFAGWFAVTFVTVLILRSCGRDTPLTTIVGLGCFELLGVARILVGSARGMHRWEFLFVMMVFGGVVFFLRAEHFESSRGLGGSSTGCGGGGCGGGGEELTVAAVGGNCATETF